MEKLQNMADNVGHGTDRSDHGSPDEDNRCSVESYDTATSQPVVIDAEVDDTVSLDSLAAPTVGSDSVKESNTPELIWDSNPQPVVIDAEVDEKEPNITELIWDSNPQLRDIHRPYPLTPGYGPAICDLANVERESFPLVAHKTPGNLLHCALWALAIAMTTYSEKTDRLELQLEQYYRYQDLLTNLNSDDFKAAIDTILKTELDPQTVEELNSPNILSADQMSQLLLIYAEDKKKSYRLAILVGDRHFFANASEANANDPIIWVQNISNSHWEGMMRPLHPDDESSDGKALDLLSSDCRYDPRALGFIPNPAICEFYDLRNFGAVTEQTELVPLRYAPTKDKQFWDQVGINTPFSAQIISAEGPQPELKDGDSYDWRSANLRFGIIKRGYAPAIRIRIEIRRGIDVEAIHIAYADFYFAPILCRINNKDKPILGVKGLKYCTKESGFELEFETEGGTPFNFLKVVSLQAKETSLLRRVYQLATTEKPMQVKLLVMHTKKELKGLGDDGATATRLDEWFRRLPGGSKPLPIFASQYTYAPYRKSKGEPRTNWGDFIKRQKLILKDAPMILASPLEMFSDPREAEVVLGYGAYLEYHEEVVLLKQYCVNSKQAPRVHKLRLAKVGGHIIACVELSNEVSLHQNILKIPDRTLFKLEWGSEKGKAKMHSLAFTTDNQFSFPYADIVMILKGPNRLARFGRHAVAPNKIIDARSYEVMMSLVANSETSKRKVSAVSEMWAVSESTDRRWWPALLNQDHTPLYSNLFEGVDKHLFQEAERKIVREPEGNFRWNARQRQVFTNLHNLTDRMLLISGPGGTGKSKLLAAIAFLCQSVGYHVGMFTPTNAAADHLAEVLYREYPSRGKALRLYPRSRETDVTALANAKMDDEAEWEEEIAMLEVVQALIEEEKNRQYRLKDFSLQQHILEHAAAGDLTCMAKYTYTDEEDNVVEKDMEKVDMWQEFNRFQAKLKEHPYEKDSIDSAWNEDEVNEFKQAYRNISNQIIGLHKVVITTSSNFVSKSITSHWAADAKLVVLVQDEAPMEKEAATYCPLTKGTWKAKVGAFIMCGDEKQLQPTVVAEGGRNAVNEFRHQTGFSLFERLRRHGFPVNHLIECHRQHPTVSKLTNAPTYNNSLKIPRERDQPLDPNIIPVLRQALQLSGDEPIDEACLRTAYVIVQGKTRFSKTTRSRANLENVKVVSGMLKCMRGYYGLSMTSKIGIITPYTEQAKQYKALFLAMRREGWRSEEIPALITVDSSQGREWQHIIFDIVNTDAEGGGLGFLRDNRRANIALTRAKEVIWIVGGAMSGKLASAKKVLEYLPDASPSEINEQTPLILIAKKLLGDMGAVQEVDVEEVKDIPAHLLSADEACLITVNPEEILNADVANAEETLNASVAKPEETLNAAITNPEEGLNDGTAIPEEQVDGNFGTDKIQVAGKAAVADYTWGQTADLAWEEGAGSIW